MDFKKEFIAEAGGLEKEIGYGIQALESIIKKYSKGGFIVRLMDKKGLGDFSKEGASIAKAAEALLEDIEEEFLMPVQMDEER